MKKETLKFVFLLLVALGGGPAGAAIWQWSTMAGSNDSADPTINFREGQAPSSVNDSARALMAVVAAWRNDISAVNTTGGTSTAYTLTTSEGVNTTPVDGQMISFIANVANGASATLTVDGGNTYPLWMFGGLVTGGTLIAGSPYRVAFSNANSAWLLEAGYANAGTPLGGILWSTAPTAPSSNFVAPSGQCISTTTYATYWVQQGSPASGSCGGGQFQIIDMRGRMAVGLDTLNASAANRYTNAANGCGTALTSVGAVCANANESSTIITTNLPPQTPNGTVGATIPVRAFDTTGVTDGTHLSLGSNAGADAGLFSATTSFTGSPFAGQNSTPMPRVPHMLGLIPYLRIL